MFPSSSHVKWTVLLVIAGLVVSAIWLNVPPAARVQAAPQATITVDRTDDPVVTVSGSGAAACTAALNDCSLRGAILVANASAGSTITIPAGIYTLSISSGGTFENGALSGDLDINASVTVNGAGSGTTTITTNYTSACGDCKVFGINQDGTHNNLAVSMSGLKISGGYNNGASYCETFFETGGGLDLFMTGGGGSLSLSDVIITNNKTTGCAQSYGGGINIDTDTGDTGSVTLTNVQITNNTADTTGGGINFFGDLPSLTINATSVISGNSTLGPIGASGNGAGINIRTTTGGSVVIHGTTIANNNAKGVGGGVAIGGANKASVVIDNAGAAASITGNTSQANGGLASEGGGLYKGDTATASLTNVTISGNHADQTAGANNPHGGAIYHEGGVLAVTNGTLDGAGGTGELFALNGTAAATVRGATIQNATTVFNNLGSATLRAYANNIQTYTAAYSGGGTPAIGHNYWGTNNPAAAAPTGMPGTEWPKRLGAPVSSWADGVSGAIGATLGGAKLTGGSSGTVVVVSHGRGNLSNVPFGNGIVPYANQTCSDYYDFFTVSGAGTFTALVPVDNNPNCNTFTLTPKVVYWITNLATCSSSTPSTLCWNLVSAGTSVNGQTIQITGLTNTDLGGTPFVAGDPSGRDPTAVTLTNFGATETIGANVAWVWLAVMVLLSLGLLLWASRRRTRV